jgi:Protein of unknown function (DUF4245)
MALSMVVLLLPIFIVIVVFRWLGGENVVAVDPSSAYADARAARMFTVAEVATPKGWQSVSASFRRDGANGVLRVGFVGPDEATAQLVEGNAADLIVTELGAGTPDGSATIAGRDWQHYTLGRGEQAVVLAETGRTILIRGKTRDAALVSLASAIRG